MDGVDVADFGFKVLDLLQSFFLPFPVVFSALWIGHFAAIILIIVIAIVVIFHIIISFVVVVVVVASPLGSPSSLRSLSPSRSPSPFTVVSLSSILATPLQAH